MEVRPRVAPVSALAVAAALLVVTATPALAGPFEPGPGPDRVVVAVLDTGIRVDHEAFADGQVVAWYDFADWSDGRGDPDVLWDPRKDPYDDRGHGTAVASMVGGVQPEKHTPSHAPGVDLAVAKISQPSGSASWYDVARAVRWAVDVVGADVISLSFYAYAPQAGVEHTLLEHLEHARDQGVLPVVLAGNGYANAGLPTESWLHPPASSPHALVVGGARGDGSPVAPLGSMDPEVTALYTTRVASRTCTTCYRTWSGTSFSTPLVAGMAAHLLDAARDAGLDDPSTDRLELLLKRAADDTAAPPNLEGYGFLDADGRELAEQHLLDGTEVPRDPQGEASALYVEVGQQAVRAVYSGDPDGAPGP